MKPKHRNKRLAIIGICAAALFAGGALLVSVIEETKQFFYDPSEVLVPGFDPQTEPFRIGGLVLPGSVEQVDELTIRFDVVDIGKGGPMATNINADVFVPVKFTGVTPDLFQEGKGVVASGRFEGDVFVADEVLARHDENYHPVKK